MNKYQIYEIAGEHNHAGTKATKDFSEIAKKMGYEILPLSMRTAQKGNIAKLQRQLGFFIDWNKIYSSVKEKSVILLQQPFHYPQLTRENILWQLKEKKNVKYISIVHDVEALRKFRYNDYYKHEFETMLKIADIIIVHNQKMAQYFMEQGIPENRLVVLKIFDYLQKIENPLCPTFEKKITVAGNLDVEKCGYIAELTKLTNIEVNLYGPNFDERMKDCSHIHYKGSYPADEIPEKLTAGFGLVWDGNSLNGCTGESGQYLRYNNPHKLSLYLSSGIPVVIWSKAAEADFVKEHNVGICVDSLFDLQKCFENLLEKDYNLMVHHVHKVSILLREGAYGIHALQNAEILLGSI